MTGDDEQPPLPPPKREMNSPFLPEQWKALAGLIGNAQVPDDRLNGKFDTKSWIIELQIEMRYSKNHVLNINIWNSTKTKTRKYIYIYI